VAAGALACSPSARYKTLTFLLDGIPPPAKSKPAPAAGDVAVSTTAVVAAAAPPLQATAGGSQTAMATLMSREAGAGDVFHPPFQSQLCQFCHNFGEGTDRLRYPLPTLCFQCHGRLDQMGPHVMWPVQQGRCVTCHNPHQAPNKKLLRMPAPRLCFQCHNPDKLKHGVDNIKCLDCHNPHSSKEPHLLKP
jgi:predicted CXXCH cytochrome family protein